MQRILVNKDGLEGDLVAILINTNISADQLCQVLKAVEKNTFPPRWPEQWQPPLPDSPEQEEE